MRYELRLTAFDMLDRVHIAVALYTQEGRVDRPSELVGTRALTVLGTGESDPWQWARDALVAALEDL